MVFSTLIPQSGSGSVGTTSVTVLNEVPPSQSRIAWTITNTSSSGQTLSVNFGTDAVAGTGIVLTPGATWFEALGGGFFPTNHKITVVSSASSGAFAFSERLMNGRYNNPFGV